MSGVAAFNTVTAAALVYQPMVEGARALAEKCASYMRDRGVDAAPWSSSDVESRRAGELGLVVTFGGDGTILRTARWLAGADVPVVGVQMGRLGFLAELLPSDLPGALESYLDGDCWLDERAMLRAAVVAPSSEPPPSADPVESHIALNDVVVGRGQSLRTVTVDLTVDGHLVHRFRCDGLIVATATGSTAYSFAAGGPILAPSSRNIAVTAICPHISSLRSLVLPGGAAIRLQVWSTQTAALSIDGQVDRPLQDGQVVETALSPCVTRFARRGTPAELYTRILAKLD